MRRTWGLREMALMAIFAMGCVTGALAAEMSAIGVANVSMPGSTTVDTDSSIRGDVGVPGSFTINTGDSVSVNAGVTVAVTDDGTSSGSGTLILQTGTTLNNNGTITFDGSAAGGHLVNDGTVVNHGTMSFGAGSSYAGSGAYQNNNNLIINTGMTGLTDLFNDTNLQLYNSGFVILEGDAAPLDGNFIFNNSVSGADAWIAINTTAGATYNNVVNVNEVQLQIASNTTFNNTVSGRNIEVSGTLPTISNAPPTAVFQNMVNASHNGTAGIFLVGANATAIFRTAAADLQSGKVDNRGIMTFEQGAIFSSVDGITSSGTLTFAAGSRYEAVSGDIVGTDGTMYYSTGMADVGLGYSSMADAFNRTTLQGASVLHLTELGGSSQNLSLVNATSANRVFIDLGGSFMGVDVKDAELIVNGNSGTGAGAVFQNAVTASQITVNNQLGAVFQDAVNGFLVVNGSGVARLDGTASFSGNDIRVNANGSLTNQSAMTTISTGNTLSNYGSFTNEGAAHFKNAGTVNNYAGATLTNSATFETSGNFSNAGSVANNGNWNVTGGNALNNGTFANGSGGVLTVASGATFGNSGTLYNAAGGTVDNDGTLQNHYTFTNDGAFTTRGQFSNSYQYVNNGLFDNQTAVAYGLQNQNGGTMWFNHGTQYQPGAGGSYLLQNAGTIYASANMDAGELRNLTGDIAMTSSSSVYNLVAETGDASINTGLAFGSAVAGSTANINPGGSSITFAAGGSFDAGQASLYANRGTTILENGAALRTQSAANGFTATDGARVVVRGTAANPSVIEATMANFTGASRLEVEQGRVLDLDLNGGNAAFGGGSRLDLAANGVVNVDGSASFGGGSELSLGEAARVNVADGATFAGGTMYVTARDNSISQLVSSGGDITVGGATEVVFDGSRQQLLDKYFLVTENGNAINGVELLHNSIYRLGKESYQTGEGVKIASVTSTLEGMTEALGGPDALSINKVNGAIYTDEVFATDWGLNNVALNQYVQAATARGIDPLLAEQAFAQLFGEYGAYAGESMLISTTNFNHAIKRRLGRLSPGDTLSVCGVCEEVVYDYCNSCDEPAVGGVYLPEYGDGRFRIWGGGFGDWADQHDRKRIHGYEYSSSGAMLGFEYAPNDCLTVGLAAAYTDGDLKVNDLMTKFSSNMYHAALYARYVHETGLYAQAVGGYGYGRGDYTVGMALGGSKSGKYDTHAYYAGAELGYMATLPGDVNLIPSVGVDFAHISQDGWKERVVHQGSVPLLANRFDRVSYNTVDIPVGLRVNKVFDFGGFALAPEAQASWIYRANDDQTRIDTGYDGAGGSTTMHGVERGPHRFIVGAGMQMRFANRFDASVGYSLEFRDRYRDHHVSGTMGIAF